MKYIFLLLIFMNHISATAQLTFETVINKVFFLGKAARSGNISMGTGIIVTHQGKYYMVTAEHVAKVLDINSFLIGSDNSKNRIAQFTDIFGQNFKGVDISPYCGFGCG